MAVVIASSHSPAMSSSEQPRTPSPAPGQEEAAVNADGASAIVLSSGMHLASHSPVKGKLITFHSKLAATDPNVVSTKSESNFFEEHLRPCPAPALRKVQKKGLISKLIADLGKTSEEAPMYRILQSLLSEISNIVFTSKQMDLLISTDWLIDYGG